MSEDVAHDFNVRPNINLPARMAVPKDMGSEPLPFHTSEVSVAADAVANGTARYRLVRHTFSQENMLDSFGRWPLPTQVRT